MPIIGKIGSGVSSWVFRGITNFEFTYDEGLGIDYWFPSVLRESSFEVKREKDCWAVSGSVQYIESDFSKIKAMNYNFGSSSERGKLVRIEIFLGSDKMLLFHRDNTDVLAMSLASRAEYNNEVRSFVGTIEFSVVLKRDCDWSNIWRDV